MRLGSKFPDLGSIQEIAVHAKNGVSSTGPVLA